MVGSGIRALGLLLLMQGSVGEGAGERGGGRSREHLSLQSPHTTLFFHRRKWNPGILLSME